MLTLFSPLVERIGRLVEVCTGTSVFVYDCTTLCSTTNERSAFFLPLTIRPLSFVLV